jgi:hypothetical protein
MRWRSALVTASSCVFVVAGCGGSGAHRAKPSPRPPRIPADVAQLLAGDADAVAAMHGCAARPAAVKLQTDVLAKIPRIPQRYREQLQSAANALVFRIPACLPPREDHGDEGDHKDHGKHKGHDKHKKHGEND